MNLGGDFPLVWAAPTGSLAGVWLCSAVSAAGGVGGMALTWTEPEVAGEMVRAVKGVTDRPFLVNFALAFPPLALDAALEAGAPIVSFSWGDPAAYVGRAKWAGALVGVQVTNVAGAKRAVDLGADFLICQGVEAGGHVQSTLALGEVLPLVVEAAEGVPVLAAGGLADGRDLASVLRMGAWGGVFGTRFLATVESRAHREYKRLLVESEGATALTLCFDGGWVSPHRVLRNSTLEAWEAQGCPVAGDRPGEGEVVARDGGGEGILRYDSAAPREDYSGEIEAMCLYAGSGCGRIGDLPSAGDLVRRLVEECREARGEG